MYIFNVNDFKWTLVINYLFESIPLLLYRKSQEDEQRMDVDLKSLVHINCLSQLLLGLKPKYQGD